MAPDETERDDALQRERERFARQLNITRDISLLHNHRLDPAATGRWVRRLPDHTLVYADEYEEALRRYEERQRRAEREPGAPDRLQGPRVHHRRRGRAGVSGRTGLPRGGTRRTSCRRPAGSGRTPASRTPTT